MTSCLSDGRMMRIVLDEKELAKAVVSYLSAKGIAGKLTVEFPVSDDGYWLGEAHVDVEELGK